MIFPHRFQSPSRMLRTVFVNGHFLLEILRRAQMQRGRSDVACNQQIAQCRVQSSQRVVCSVRSA